MNNVTLLALLALVCIVAFYAVVPPVADAKPIKGGCPAIDAEMEVFKSFHKLAEDMHGIREALQALVEIEKRKYEYSRGGNLSFGAQQWQ